MKTRTGRLKVDAFARLYEAALADYLAGGAGIPPAGVAGTLGRQAVLIGFSVSDLAKVHKHALPAAVGSSSRSGEALKKEAQAFLAAVTLEQRRSDISVVQTKLLWKEMNETLRRRTSELAHSKRNVEKRIVKRKAAEQTLTSKNAHYAKLLKESMSIQKRLRQSAHRVLSALENERDQISRALHDETAQTLLGISVRLLALQQQGSQDARKLLREIASTQELVNKSMILLRARARRRRHEK